MTVKELAKKSIEYRKKILTNEYTYRESEGNHTWNVWRLYLTERAPKFFK